MDESLNVWDGCGEQTTKEWRKGMKPFTFVYVTKKRKTVRGGGSRVKESSFHGDMFKCSASSYSKIDFFNWLIFLKVLVQFIGNHPQSKQPKHYVDFFIAQLEYEYEDGRVSAIEMLNSLFESFTEVSFITSLLID